MGRSAPRQKEKGKRKSKNREEPSALPRSSRFSLLSSLHFCLFPFYFCLLLGNHAVRNEAAGVAGDGAVVLADAHAASLVVDDPGADHRREAVEGPRRRQLLVDERPVADKACGMGIRE